MSSNGNTKERRKITVEQRILAKNSVLSFIITYSNYFSSMVTSFMVARLITQDEWGYLILATSYLMIILTILGFIPPGLSASLNYYIPRYLALNQKAKLKSFIKNAFIIRISILTVAFVISIIVFIFFSNLFSVNLFKYEHLLVLLSPLILIDGIDKMIGEMNVSFNRFNFVLILIMIKNLFNIFLLIFCIIFFYDVQLETIVLINIITAAIPFIINALVSIFYLRSKFRDVEDEIHTLKETIKDISIYGTHLSITNLLDRFAGEIRVQTIGIFGTTDFVTGYNIGNHYREVSTGSIGALNKPLIISFAGLYATKKHDQIDRTYRVLLKYMIFMQLVITGFLIFFTDFYLSFIYGASYLKFSLLVKLILISIAFRVPVTYFFSLLKASEKVKNLIPINFVLTIASLSFFLFGLIYFGVIGAIVGIIIINCITTIFILVATLRILKIKVDAKMTLLQFSIFFIAVIISLIMETLFLNNLNLMILQTLNLTFFEKFNFFSLGTFLIIFLTLNIFLKILTRSDIERIETFFDKPTFSHRTIRKGLGFLKKIFKK